MPFTDPTRQRLTPLPPYGQPPEYGHLPVDLPVTREEPVQDAGEVPAEQETFSPVDGGEWSPRIGEAAEGSSPVPTEPPLTPTTESFLETAGSSPTPMEPPLGATELPPAPYGDPPPVAPSYQTPPPPPAPLTAEPTIPLPAEQAAPFVPPVPVPTQDVNHASLPSAVPVQTGVSPAVASQGLSPQARVEHGGSSARIQGDVFANAKRQVEELLPRLYEGKSSPQPKRWVITLLLSIFLGAVGAADIYLGYMKVAVARIALLFCGLIFSFLSLYARFMGGGLWSFLSGTFYALSFLVFFLSFVLTAITIVFIAIKKSPYATDANGTPISHT